MTFVFRQQLPQKKEKKISLKEVQIGFFKKFHRLVARFRYPVSLPEDITTDLGCSLPKISNFFAFIESLSNLCPKKLYKFMSKREAESSFCCALKKETFQSTTFFSYFFNQGWIVIALHFDEKERLRRVYVQCPADHVKEGFDISLPDTGKN